MEKEDYQLLQQAFKEQGERIYNILAALTPADWEKPSTLPDWNVHLLAAHIYRSPMLLVTAIVQPRQIPPVKQRYDYYDFDGSSIGAAVTTRSMETAAGLPAAELPGLFISKVQEASNLLERANPTMVVDSTFGPIELGDYLATRLVELTVHTFDLTTSLGIPESYSPAALATVVDILDNLYGQPRPAELADDAAFMVAATGRKPFPGLALSAFS